MRAFLGGRDVPRSEFALIGLDGGPSGGTGGVVLLLDDGDIFHPADYTALGFTNYEVECIGAAGGRGGDWAGNGPAPFCAGGAGGGGGLHKAIGLLEDLPDDVPAAVGQPGGDGRNSNNVPPWRGKLNSSGQFDYVRDGDGFAIDLELITNPSYISPLDGGDGGLSSFGDVCWASGGKGGKAAQLFTVEPYPLFGLPYTGYYGGLYYSYIFNPGSGGDGGLGGRDEPGGGGAGGVVLYVPSIVTFGPDQVLVYASDGVTTWRVPRPVTHGTAPSTQYLPPHDGGWDGHVGGGGGGGYGGARNFISGGPIFGDGSSTAYIAKKDGTGGGRGSMNYADTSVYGTGENASVDSAGTLTEPGSGGGAKLNKLARYGSHAKGYDPKGVVQIRLTKVE